VSSGYVDVQPGKTPTQLQGIAFADATIIYNTDDTNAVWIGSGPSLVPGLGLRLAALGSLQWSSKQGIPYAICDTGVTDPVTLNISDDVNTYSDPVAQGVATAEAVAALGIPVKVVTETIANGVQVLKGQSQSFDISKYSTVSVLLAPPVGNLPGSDSVKVTQTDDSGLILDSLWCSIQQEFRWNVINDKIGITLGISASNPYVTVFITGTTRPIPNRLDSRSSQGMAHYQLLGPTVSGDTQPFNQISQAGLSDFFGPLWVAGYITDATTEGNFRLTAPDDLSATAITFMTTSEAAMPLVGSAQRFSKMIAAPLGGYPGCDFNSITGGPGNINLFFTPAFI